jgi:hypothetical protein
MTRRRAMVAALTVGLVLAAGLVRAQQAGTPVDGRLKVQLEYKGKGTVDAAHQMWIWVFDTPNITAESNPIATGVLKENKTAYKFAGLPKDVYIAVAYDEKGGYDGTSGPPPQGTPIAIRGGSGLGSPATSVPTGGDDAKVEISFDDTVRMP